MNKAMTLIVACIYYTKLVLLNRITHSHGHSYISQFLKDWVLVLAVAVLVSIDIIILVTYTTVEGVRGNLNAILLSNEENFISLFGVSGMKRT